MKIFCYHQKPEQSIQNSSRQNEEKVPVELHVIHNNVLEATPVTHTQKDMHSNQILYQKLQTLNTKVRYLSIY